MSSLLLRYQPLKLFVVCIMFVGSSHFVAHATQAVKDAGACRFDIMGHIMLSSMKKAQAALKALTVEEHGVDGSSIYLYGEAWDFGECAGNQRGRNACQVNTAGTGLGANSLTSFYTTLFCLGARLLSPAVHFMSGW